MSTADFPNVGAQIAFWMKHITKRFMGGWSGSGENGIDFGMPTGTPVYAIEGGQVVGHGYYGGGGVVSVEAQKGKVWYYQHLDLNEPGIESGKVTQVQAGQLVGWSGGQLSGGNHPSSKEFSGGPHIEVGINAPWGHIWGPMSEKGPNIDPLPYINAIAQQGGGGPTGSPLGFPNPLDPGSWLDGLKKQFGTLFTWLTDPLRILKLVAGAGTVLVAIWLTVVSIGAHMAPGALQVAGTASGQPEVALAGTALKSGASPQQRAAAGRNLIDTPKQRQARQQARDQSQRAAGQKQGAEGERTAAKAKRSAAAKRGAATRAANKQPKEQPVYYGGKRVGVERGGQVVLDKPAGQEAS